MRPDQPVAAAVEMRARMIPSCRSTHKPYSRVRAPVRSSCAENVKNACCTLGSVKPRMVAAMVSRKL
jgi:hypothetical protein